MPDAVAAETTVGEVGPGFEAELEVDELDAVVEVKGVVEEPDVVCEAALGLGEEHAEHASTDNIEASEPTVRALGTAVNSTVGELEGVVRGPPSSHGVLVGERRARREVRDVTSDVRSGTAETTS